MTADSPCFIILFSFNYRHVCVVCVCVSLYKTFFFFFGGGLWIMDKRLRNTRLDILLGSKGVA